MSEKIVISLTESRLQVAPGSSVETTAMITNAGDVVEAYQLALEGIDPDWCSLSVSSASLFPGDQVEATIQIQPPRAAESKAGTYEVTLKATSTRDPSVEAAAPLTVVVQSVLLYDVAITPKKATGRTGDYTLTIRNSGNAPTTYTLSGEDREAACRYDFGKHTIVVEAGGASHVPLVVRPKHKIISGQPKHHRFEITVTPHAGEGAEVKTVAGELEQRPQVPRWAFIAAAASLMVIVLLAVFVRCGTEGPLTLTVSPANPSASDQVTFTAASDLADLDEIELFVNDELVATCDSSPCTYTGGPYPEGTLTYYATVSDSEGNTWDNQGAQLATAGAATSTPTSTPAATATPAPTPAVTQEPAPGEASIIVHSEIARPGDTVAISGSGWGRCRLGAVTVTIGERTVLTVTPENELFKEKSPFRTCLMASTM